MSDLTFSQPERRNFVVPILVALVLIGGVFAYVYLNPHRIADITVTHTAILPTHTVYKTDSKLVGHKDQAEDDLYVLTTIRIDNRLKTPLVIDSITAALAGKDDTDDTAATTSAIQKNDIDSLYVTFPALKPLGSAPLLRETAIQPGEHVEGMVMLHFPVDQAAWDQRKSATVTIAFYHQDPFTVTVPKP
jgi:hypothetical protein